MIKPQPSNPLHKQRKTTWIGLSFPLSRECWRWEKLSSWHAPVSLTIILCRPLLAKDTLFFIYFLRRRTTHTPSPPPREERLIINQRHRPLSISSRSINVHFERKSYILVGVRVLVVLLLQHRTHPYTRHFPRNFKLSGESIWLS